MNFKPKKIWIIIGIILLLFIITNPSIKRFKDYKGETSYRGLKRIYNFIVCSVYEDGGSRYLGVGLNFIPLSEGHSYGRHQRPSKPIDKRDWPVATRIISSANSPSDGAIRDIKVDARYYEQEQKMNDSTFKSNLINELRKNLKK